MNRRFYFRTSPFALGKVLMALLDDDNVEQVCVSLEDNDLLVSFSNRKRKICSTVTSEPCDMLRDKIIDKEIEK